MIDVNGVPGAGNLAVIKDKPLTLLVGSLIAAA
jgi:hypothetical protein